MQFMTMLAISLLAGFTCGGLVWVIWSICEVVSARRKASADSAKTPNTEKKAAKDGKA